MTEKTTPEAERLSPEWKPWRVREGLSILRLKVDVRAAAIEPARRAGDLVLAAWTERTPHFAAGWLLRGLGFICILDDRDVEVVER